MDLLIIAVAIAGDCVGAVFGSETNSTATINYDFNFAKEEKVGIEDQIIHINNGCDESKCVTRSWSPFNYSFTCYTDGDRDPMMCADGYKPRIVDMEPLIYYEEWYGDDITYQYFSCCPPNLSSDVDVSRHCSNSTSMNNGLEDPSNNMHNTMVCDDTTRPYRRDMKTRKHSSDGELPISIESYICCDSIINEKDNDNHTISYLDEIECVPYYNKFYEQYNVFHNSYGVINPVLCDEPESGFQFPRYVEYSKTSSLLYRFECCKTGPAQPPFIQDYWFKVTIYPQIAISAIAVTSSMVLIIALLIPLLRNLRTKDTNNAVTSMTSATTNRSAGTRRRPQRSTEPAYSSYNLYLVYLAIPDVIFNLYLLTMYGRYANQNFNPNFYGNIVLSYGGLGNGFVEGAFFNACAQEMW
jgi:hypothetical protein